LVVMDAMQGWSVYIHTGASVQKYNEDRFRPERWLEQGSGHSKSSSSPAGEQPASSDGGSETPEGGGTGSDAAKSAAWESKSGCPEHSLPFGLGPRMCLGRHIVKAALILLVAELVSKHEWQMQDPNEQWSVFPTVRPKQGLQVHSFR